MIDREDVIVSVSYPFRSGFSGDSGRVETYTLVGSPENVSKMVAKQVQTFLERGSAMPMTLHATGGFNVIDANDRADQA